MPGKTITRFAPSPTGYLHIGGARTALFNWLLARKTGGVFILRIEDTDTKRNTPTAVRQVISDLKWLGINWDEGPQVGGPNGPYLQSQRKDIYDKYVRQLLEEKKAYYCFESRQDLDEMRKNAEAQKKGFMYKRPDVFPTEAEAEKAGTEGKSVTVRFAMPAETIVVSDVVRGDVTFNGGELGDFIIQKSDGLPTYNFACVVDDALMGITHVIRGQEHLMNTPGQQMLWRALGFGPLPKYAHMSVTISAAGGKLSKRERPKALRNAIKTKSDIDLDEVARIANITVDELNDFLTAKSSPALPAVEAMAEKLGVRLPEINVVDFFRSGYLPEALLNFIALLGWNPGGKREIMPIEELIESFDISRLTKSNSLFDRAKLVAFNTEHIRMLDETKLLAHLREYLEAIDSPVASADDELLERLVKICEGARTLADIERKCRFLFVADNEIRYDEKAVKKVLKSGVSPQDKPGGFRGNGLEMLKVVRGKLAAMKRFTEEGIENMLRSLAQENQVGLGKVAQPLRVAITGTTVSPPIFDSVQLLGKEKTLDRIDITLSRFES